jgi:hypothetical protein
MLRTEEEVRKMTSLLKTMVDTYDDPQTAYIAELDAHIGGYSYDSRNGFSHIVVSYTFPRTAWILQHKTAENTLLVAPLKGAAGLDEIYGIEFPFSYSLYNFIGAILYGDVPADLIEDSLDNNH